MATITNLTLYVGEDQPFTDTIFKGDGITPQDITNWGLTFVVHAYGDPGIVYITKTIGAGITVPVPSNGQATIGLVNADTVNMLPNQYEWYMRRSDASNSKLLSGGLFTLTRL